MPARRVEHRAEKVRILHLHLRARRPRPDKKHDRTGIIAGRRRPNRTVASASRRAQRRGGRRRGEGLRSNGRSSAVGAKACQERAEPPAFSTGKCMYLPCTHRTRCPDPYRPDTSLFSHSIRTLGQGGTKVRSCCRAACRPYEGQTATRQAFRFFQSAGWGIVGCRFDPLLPSLLSLRAFVIVFSVRAVHCVVELQKVQPAA